MAEISGRGYKAHITGKDASAGIMIIAFMAGIVILFYYLAKKEVSSVTDAITKPISDTVKVVSDAVGGATTGFVDLMERTNNQLLGASIVSKEHLNELYPGGYTVIGESESGVDIAFEGASNPALYKSPEGDIPDFKLYKDGKWYLLYGCDASGYNCKTYREATIIDRLNLDGVWGSIREAV